LGIALEDQLDTLRFRRPHSEMRAAIRLRFGSYRQASGRHICDVNKRCAVTSLRDFVYLLGEACVQG
jgi:hypothetical protein